MEGCPAELLYAAKLGVIELSSWSVFVGGMPATQPGVLVHGHVSDPSLTPRPSTDAQGFPRIFKLRYTSHLRSKVYPDSDLLDFGIEIGFIRLLITKLAVLEHQFRTQPLNPCLDPHPERRHRIIQSS